MSAPYGLSLNALIHFLISTNFFPIKYVVEKDFFCVNKSKIYFFNVKKSSRTKFYKTMSINSP